jgi:hypothetical protein
MDETLAAIGCVLLFGVFYSGLLWFISRIGGWRTLATEFPDRPVAVESHVFRIEDQPFERSLRRFYWQSLMMGPPYFPSNYGSCVNVDVGERGIRLQVSLPFRLFHPPVLLPWSAIEGCESQRVMYFWTRTKVALQGQANPIYFGGKSEREIEGVWRSLGIQASVGSEFVAGRESVS